MTGTIIDEVIIGRGEYRQAFGHTESLLVYWDRKGRSYTAQRDKGKRFRNMHEELYSAIYERDNQFDTQTQTIFEKWKQLQESRQRKTTDATSTTTPPSAGDGEARTGECTRHAKTAGAPTSTASAPKAATASADASKPGRKP